MLQVSVNLILRTGFDLVPLDVVCVKCVCVFVQEIVSLLSGRSALSQRSQMALAEAALLLSELRGTGSQTLHLLTQKMLQQQVSFLLY